MSGESFHLIDDIKEFISILDDLRVVNDVLAMRVVKFTYLDDDLQQDGIQVEQSSVLFEVEAIKGEILIHLLLVFNQMGTK
jgi:hypothetical protein